MRSFRLLCVVFVCFATFLRGQSPALPPKEKFHLFLLVGQSNMAGRGVVSPADNAPHPRVLMLTKAGTWVPAVDPLHFDKPTAVGVGLGVDYAIYMLDRIREEVRHRSLDDAIAVALSTTLIHWVQGMAAK